MWYHFHSNKDLQLIWPKVINSMTSLRTMAGLWDRESSEGFSALKTHTT